MCSFEDFEFKNKHLKVIRMQRNIFQLEFILALTMFSLFFATFFRLIISYFQLCVKKGGNLLKWYQHVGFVFVWNAFFANYGALYLHQQQSHVLVYLWAIDCLIVSSLKKMRSEKNVIVFLQTFHLIFNKRKKDEAVQAYTGRDTWLTTWMIIGNYY